MPVVIVSSGDEVNVNLQSRHWFLTWNNPVLTGPDRSIDVLLETGGLKKYMIQVERGVGGTTHLQGVMSFGSVKFWSTLRNHAKIYWKPCRNLRKCVAYCQKVESRVGQIYWKGYKPKDKGPRDPLEGVSLYEWQDKILDMVRGVADDRSIHWFWSNSGNIGKTALAKHMCLKYGAIMVGGKCSDAYYFISDRVKKGHPPDIVLFNLVRSKGNDIDYEGLEGVKDGIFFCGKYESCQVVYDPPWVIVFANQPPDLSKLSDDRWKVVCLD